MKDGGPAFPRPLSKFSPEEVSGDQDGMSLRDYFADGAKNSLIISWPEGRRVNDGWIADIDYPVLAGEAYKIADAMLKEREKEIGERE